MINLKILSRLQKWAERRAVRDQLGRLTDRELRDIGLDRGTIDAVASGRLRR